MDDFVKFLLIAGVIIVGIFKEVNKKSKAKKAETRRAVTPQPSPIELAPDATPIPETWGEPMSLEDLFQPKRTKRPVAKPNPQTVVKPKKKKEEVSVAASIANSSAQDKINTKFGSQYDYQEPEADQDFSINSTEDARRAIIWGEIMQRKY